MNGKWIEVFKAGKHVAADGTECTFTSADLDKICNYDPKKHEAPLVVGHPKANHPAYGWVEAVRRNGTSLEIMPRQVNADFEELVKSGAYKKRSISLYPDGTLRHVGFLGAQPPAVKGLKDIDFGDNDDCKIYEFEEKGGGNMPDNDKPADKSAEIDALKGVIDSQKAQIDELAAEITKLKDVLAKSADATALKEAENFCEALVAEGKLTPAQKAEAVKLLIVKDGTVNFSESESMPVRDAVKKFLSTMPKQVSFNEFAKNGDSGGVKIPNFAGANVNPERAVMYAKAKEFQEKDKSLTFEQAVDKAMKEDK